MAPTGGATVDLRAFTSRWVLDWLATEPDERHRRLDAAALVFLDISGFTAMSEMLAGLGRLGAEEVREVVNQTFTSLLDIAYAQGASLLKFGGDALLLLFVGEGADEAAVHSAWRMREQLFACNPVATAAGSLDLSMTVGVHAGPADLFLVGDNHRELIVAGPAGTAVIETEGAADRGEILLSPHVPVDRPGMEVEERDDGLYQLLAVEVDPTATDPAPDEALPLPADHQVLSPRVRERVAEDHSGEHRQATVAFIHFSGTDQVLADRGPQALAEALDELTTVVQRACVESDVCFLSNDIDADGGKFILTAGVPTAADDDDDRMVNACRAIVAAHPRLHVQIGINRGPVFAGVVGPPYRLTYTVLGDAVNLAARIMSRAEHGQVLAESGVLNRCRSLYDAQLLEPFHVKGKQAPIRASTVGDELGVRIRIRTDHTGFVGRRQELDHLVEIVDAIDAYDHGHAVCLTGPAGVGKSRLIDELQERRPDVPLQLVACSRFGADRPYRTAQMLLRLVLTGERHGRPEPVIAAARRLAGDHPDVAPWIPLLADVFDVDISDTPETAALAPGFRAAQTRRTISLLLASALWGKAIIVVEDIQWLDPESRELLAEQGRHMLSERPWLVVGTTRDPGAVVDGMEEIALGPLDDEAARQLALSAVDRGEIPMDRAATLVERSGGNPLFLIELIRGAAEGEMPDSLESLFQNRLDALPAPQRRLLRNAAVLGLEFPPELLESLSEAAHDIDLSDLDELGEFVTRMRSGYWRFTQSLHQEVAYGSLPYRTRRALHAQAARALEAIQQEGGIIAIEALSRHHHLAGEYDKSWRSSRQAFAVARGRSAVETAARFARRALEAGRRTKAPQLAMARTWEGLGDMLELSGNYADAEEAYRAARAKAAPPAQARLCRKVGHVKSQRGEYSLALRWYTRARRAAEGLDRPSELAQTTVSRAITLMRQGRRRQALELAEQVEAMRAVSVRDRGRALWVKGWALAEEMAPDAAFTLTQAAELFNAEGESALEAHVVNALGADAYFRGNWRVAAEHYRRAVDICSRMGDRASEAMSAANLGEILGDQGEFVRARDALKPAHEFGRASKNIYIQTGTLLFMARAAARMGDTPTAAAELDEVVELADAAGISILLIEARLRQAELALFSDDLSLATDFLHKAAYMTGPHPPRMVLSLMRRLQGCVAAEVGDPFHELLAAAVRAAVGASSSFDEFLARGAMHLHELRDDESWLARRANELGLTCPWPQLVHGAASPPG